MITKRQYIEYLISTPVNYTCSHLADHLEGVSHDTITDYLQREKLTARRLWELVQPLVKDSEAAYLLVDDSVQNKQYSRKIELVRKQYSGAVHGLVRGIGIINLVHSDGEDFYPIDVDTTLSVDQMMTIYRKRGNVEPISRSSRMHRWKNPRPKL